MRIAFVTFAVAGLSFLVPIAGQESAAMQPDDAGFRRVAVPFLKRHCLRCHGPETQEGEFRIDQHLKNDFLDRAASGKWGEVVNMLNSHEMPPEDETQPSSKSVATLVDWITGQMAKAELHRRDSAIVLRRMNRSEYKNTIRDLIGIDFDAAVFPQDPPAGGFDNNGGALTVSPLHLELYYAAAREILDHALVEGPQPPSLKWRIEPDSGDSDSNRVTYDGQRLIVNGGKNPVENGFKVLHHANWDKKLNARDFRLPHEGEYIIRIRAAGRVPDREAVVAAAGNYLEQRMQRQMKENPKGEKWHREQLEKNLEHFRTDRMYDYGPPRLKLIQNLGGQPVVLAEFDVDASLDAPKIYEVRAPFTTASAGLTIEYAYSVPAVLENFWCQTGDDFARPELLVDWFEIEGPLHSSWPPESHQRILFASPNADRDERAYAREVVARFMRRAYRRPVSDVEVDEKLKLFDAVRGDAPSFVQAIKTPLAAVLVSPHFLFLAEPGTSDEDESAAQPPPIRELTDKQGRALEARVVGTEDDKVVVERADGKRYSLALGIFSEESQTTIKTDVARIRKLQEQNSPAGSARRLNDHELASRLSYFLWSSMPDEELFGLAESERLSDDAVLSAQIDRLLADPNSEALIRNFAGQWLGLREVGANPPAQDLYPRYDRHLETSIVRESEAFFAEILRNDLSVMNFVKSDFVVINERLARFYGIDGVSGDEFRRVDVSADSHRGGVVTQASVLSITSNGTRTSPVKRGTWVMKNMLGIDPGLPVANAGEIAPKVPGIDKATVRQRLEIHRELPQCARCHNKIDPLGFALENFNAAGEWRDQEGFGYKGRIGANDPIVDASARMIDGTEFVGAAGLQDVLMTKKDLFLGCLAAKLFTYALGRELGIADQLHVKAAVEQMKKNGDTLRTLIKFIATSEPFLTK